MHKSRNFQSLKSDVLLSSPSAYQSINPFLTSKHWKFNYISFNQDTHIFICLIFYCDAFNLFSWKRSNAVVSRFNRRRSPFERSPTLALSTYPMIITIGIYQDNDQHHDSPRQPQIDISYKLESEPVFSLKAMISAHNQRDSGGFIIPQVIRLRRILVSIYSSYIFRYIYRSTI